MDTAARSKLAEQVYRLHLAFIRKANDAYVFLLEAIPLLDEAGDRFVAAGSQKVRSYMVPAVDGRKVSKRTPEQLRAIYDRFISRELVENFIVTAVSQFESLLFDVLRLVIRQYPKKLTCAADGQAGHRQVSLDLLLRASTLEEAIAEVIEHRLVSISYAKPQDYLRYIKTVTGITTEDAAFLDFIEIKATRDIIIHNGGVANEVYEEKVGKRKRGERGKPLPIDVDYFKHCIATLKRCSGIISRDVDAAFPHRARVKLVR